MMGQPRNFGIDGPAPSYGTPPILPDQRWQGQAAAAGTMGRQSPARQSILEALMGHQAMPGQQPYQFAGKLPGQIKGGLQSLGDLMHMQGGGPTNIERSF